jgi:putative glycosyltransferase (TIGR04348 family)
MSIPSVVIVSPALADANNGNWRTAERWRGFAGAQYRARIAGRWPDAEAGGNGDDLMIALHARRSAPSIQAWAAAHPGRGLAVVLTGTDLYQDILGDASARRSLELAQRLVVLQERGPDALPEACRGKTRVIFQSAASHPHGPPEPGRLRALMVGHLRQVKSPRTLFEAARLLRDRPDIRIEHIGDDRGDTTLGEEARATARDCPPYRWLGGRTHEETLQAIRNADVLVHTSALEGGAHVILEALRCGTPVLASRVPGNIGMLGPHYAGYFSHGEAHALAQLLLRCRDETVTGEPAGLLPVLRAQCDARAPLFAPAAEQAALRSLLAELATGA